MTPSKNMTKDKKEAEESKKSMECEMKKEKKKKIFLNEDDAIKDTKGCMVG